MKKPEVAISIDGKELKTFSKFILHQRMQDHHTFELVVGYQIIESAGSHLMERSKKWIGKDLVASLDPDHEFKGIVTSVNMAHFHGMFGDLIIKGYSPTILLEAGPHKQSWNDKTIKQIVEDVIGAAGISASINPKFSSPLSYTAQYRESHFEFLKRLAGSYHEWLFYDGQQLHFGQPNTRPEISMEYGMDVEKIELSMRIAPVSFEGFSYNYERDEVLLANSGTEVQGLNDLGLEAFEASKSRFGIQTRSAIHARINSKGQLDEHLDEKRAESASNLTWISGNGRKIGLRPGIVAKIEAAKKQGDSWTTEPYGNYMIVNVIHTISGNYEYSNYFEGIPAALQTLPKPEFQVPVAEPQVATVLSNEDPAGQGRVQVRMLWQNGTSMKSPWIRVLTPDAGTSDQVGTNRGFVFIPEAGDQVMVGFRYNDPSRPYVMGSLFHGMTGGGGGGANATKSLTTRSGATISLNDDNGQGSITISDPSGNKVIMNGDGTMEITAPNKLDLNSKEINIKASQDINVEAGKNITTSAGMSINESAKMNIATTAGMGIEQMASLGVALVGGKGVNLSAGGGSSLGLSAGGVANLVSKKKIEIDSGNILDIAGKNKAMVKGKKLELTGKTKAELKASKVKLS